MGLRVLDISILQAVAALQHAHYTLMQKTGGRNCSMPISAKPSWTHDKQACVNHLIIMDFSPSLRCPRTRQSAVKLQRRTVRGWVLRGTGLPLLRHAEMTLQGSSIVSRPLAARPQKKEISGHSNMDQQRHTRDCRTSHLRVCGV